MIVLGLDTALTACSVAVIDRAAVLASRSEPMTRGHQERLAPMVAEVMAEAGITFDALDRVGVTIGPGGFTGLRVGLAFVKGLAVALDIPCVGVTTLAALAASSGAAAIDAKRGEIYLLIEGGEPEAVTVDDAVARLATAGPVTLGGSAAPMLAEHLPNVTVAQLDYPDPATVARLAAAVSDPQPPRPLYLRAPDARLPS